MSRLTDLIAQAKAKDPQLGADLEREYKVLSSRRAFGLNFERHRPEAVELPNRPVRKGDKVRVLPERGSTKQGDRRLWKVRDLQRQDGRKLAQLDLVRADEPAQQTVSVEDLVVVAEFRDRIYPGMVSTGKVERGGDKPYHSVINAENYLALKALMKGGGDDDPVLPGRRILINPVEVGPNPAIPDAVGMSSYPYPASRSPSAVPSQ